MTGQPGGTFLGRDAWIRAAVCTGEYQLYKDPFDPSHYELPSLVFMLALRGRVLYDVLFLHQPTGLSNHLTIG